MSRDHPVEITRARKTLWPEFKQMKSLNPAAKVAIVYPAKLMIDGKVVKDLFPELDLVIRGSRLDIRHPSQQSARLQQQQGNAMQSGTNPASQSTPMHNPPNETAMDFTSQNSDTQPPSENTVAHNEQQQAANASNIGDANAGGDKQDVGFKTPQGTASRPTSDRVKPGTSSRANSVSRSRSRSASRGRSRSVSKPRESMDSSQASAAK